MIPLFSLALLGSIAADSASPSGSGRRTLVLWHGGQRWDGPPEVKPAKKGTHEHGPGLYLTTSASTARKYAKGGGSIIRVELDPDLTWLEGALISASSMTWWLKSRERLRNRQKVIDDLAATSQRLNRDVIPASVLVNLMVNHEAITGGHGPALAQLLSARGIDASLVRQGNEDWVVLFNPARIVSWKKVPAGETNDLPRVEDQIQKTVGVRKPDTDIPSRLDLALRVTGGAPPIRAGDKPPFQLVWTPMNQRWKAQMDEVRQSNLDFMNPKWDLERNADFVAKKYKLDHVLLAFGGDRTGIDALETEVDDILERGQLLDGKNAVLRMGEPSQCHRNAARLFLADPERTILLTGYALSDDGLWRQHSAAIRETPEGPVLIETTAPRVAYFVFPMVGADARGWALGQAP
jgi:hypothetical protein